MITTDCSSAGQPEGGQADTNEQWAEREDALREQEWEMAEKLLGAARTLLRRVLYRKKREATASDIARLLELASQLGRLSTGLGNSREEGTGGWSAAYEAEWERALIKVYGGKGGGNTANG